MPWRNGGGETIELAAHPHDAEYGVFDWRVSLARIDRDGPFSAFPGVDRTFSVIDGDGVDLTLGAEPPRRLTREVACTAFPGEEDCRCHLIRGPVTALNVMVARGRVACAIAPLATGREWSATVGDRIVICAEGSVATNLGPAGRHDAIFVPSETSVELRPSAGATLALVVTLMPVVHHR